MSVFDRIHDDAIRRLIQLQNDPGYRALQRQLEEEQRNPSLRAARDMLNRQMELEQRDPGLRILREKLQQEQSNPLLTIGRERIEEAINAAALFDVSNRALEQFNRYSINDHLRDWERTVPNWILNQTSRRTSSFESAISQFASAQRIAEQLAAQSHIDWRNLDRVRGLNAFASLGRDLSKIADLAPPEGKNTFLFNAAERLNRIQHFAELRDVGSLDNEVESLISYILSWIKDAGSKLLSRDVVLALLIPVMIAALQQAQSYKWRLDDQTDADRRAEEQNARLDALLRAVNELQTESEEPKIGKPYKIKRTTATFARPGARQQRIGYVYSGQSVLAIASTGRWILIKYTDPINLERREGWIRKKYAKRQQSESTENSSKNDLRLLFALDLYQQGNLSFPEASQLAGLPKHKFIEVGADTITDFRVDPQLEERIEELATKSTEGELTNEERAEYSGYVRANKLLAIRKRQTQHLTNSRR